MKPLKLSFALILIGSALLLSGASESAEQLAPKQSPQSSRSAESKKTQAGKPASKGNQEEKPSDKELPTPKQPSTGDFDQQRGYEKRQIQIQERIADYTYALVIVGGILGCLQVMVMLFTYFVTNKAANAAENSTKIATQQSEFLRNRERPWLLVQAENWKMPGPYDRGFGGPVEWTIANVGRSPALITELVAEVDVVPYPLEDKMPIYSAPAKFARFIIGPNGKHTTQAENIVDAAELQSIFTGKMCLMFFGYIRYEDMVGTQHRTRFCSTWRIDGEYWIFQRIGPSSYIEYT